MTRHTKIEGINFIDGITILGKLLGYHTETEHKIDSVRKTSSAVDVAWFKEKGQKFPLFIFEIESTATNSMAYNPVKVFSKKNEHYEKPLFFFQIVLRKGRNSERISDLRHQFGTYNYRVYKISTKERQYFIYDVLTQHRRLTDRLSVSDVLIFFTNSKWLDIDLAMLADHIEDLGFESKTGQLLSSYVSLTSIYPLFIPTCTRLIEKVQKEYHINNFIIAYPTYIGDTMHFPIHQGILFSGTTDLYKKNKAFEILKPWQESNSYLSMIGPHFGLSQDYDMFIIWGAGGLFGLLSLLFENNDGVRLYLSEQLLKIIEKCQPDHRITNLIWLLYLLPRNKKGEKIYTEIVRPCFKEIGSFSINHLMYPPFLEFEFDFENDFLSHKEPIPTYNEIIDFFEKNSPESAFNPIQLACLALTSNNDVHLGRKIILTLLCSNFSK